MIYSFRRSDGRKVIGWVSFLRAPPSILFHPCPVMIYRAWSSDVLKIVCFGMAKTARRLLYLTISRLISLGCVLSFIVNTVASQSSSVSVSWPVDAYILLQRIHWWTSSFPLSNMSFKRKIIVFWQRPERTPVNLELIDDSYVTSLCTW